MRDENWTYDVGDMTTSANENSISKEVKNKEATRVARNLIVKRKIMRVGLGVDSDHLWVCEIIDNETKEKWKKATFEKSEDWLKQHGDTLIFCERVSARLNPEMCGAYPWCENCNRDKRSKPRVSDFSSGAFHRANDE